MFTYMWLHLSDGKLTITPADTSFSYTTTAVLKIKEHARVQIYYSQYSVEKASAFKICPKLIRNIFEFSTWESKNGTRMSNIRFETWIKLRLLKILELPCDSHITHHTTWEFSFFSIFLYCFVHCFLLQPFLSHQSHGIFNISMTSIWMDNKTNFAMLTFPKELWMYFHPSHSMHRWWGQHQNQSHSF